MSKRFSDRSDVRDLIKKSSDFQLRGYGSYVVWVCISIIIISLAVKFHLDGVAEGLLLEEEGLNVDDILIGVITMVIASMVVGGYLLVNIFRLRMIIDAIEFQSIIFSSSMRAHSLFCFLVNTEHLVVYMDKGTVKVLGLENDDAHSLADILSSKVISKENGGRIIESIAQGKSDEIAVSYKDSKGNAKDAIITVDALKKPKGYFAIRGYSLKENRF